MASHTSEHWQVEEVGLEQGAEAYVKYAEAVAILNDPEATQPIHNRQPETQPEAIIDYCEHLIVEGLKEVVIQANRPHSSPQDRERNFPTAYIQMLRIRRHAYDGYEQRLHLLNPFLAAVQPLPTLEETIYRYISHGSYGKLRTDRMLGGFTVAEVFEPHLGNARRLSQTHHAS